MSENRKELTSTQKGIIAENLVANHIMIETKGRLSPFKPLADDEGIDFLIYDKKTGESIPIQVKSRTATIVRGGKETNTVHFEIRKVSIKDVKSAYFLAILLSKNMHSIDRAWLIPMKKIPNVLSQKTTQPKYIMRANRNLNANDKYSQFQCKDVKEIVRRIIEISENE